MSLEPDRLLSRVVWGMRVEEGEFAEVAVELGAPVTAYRRATLLQILGRGRRTEHRALVEGYLESPADPALASVALTILVDWWDLRSEYRSELLRFAHGVDWDEYAEVRSTALGLLGDDPGAHALLLEIATDPGEWEPTRTDAVRALARGLGLEVPPSPDPAWSRDVVDEARRRIS